MREETVRRLIDVVARTGPVLLDFDGPVCGLFAGGRVATVAARLRDVLAAHGVDLGTIWNNDQDLLNLLQRFQRFAPDLLPVVENALVHEEVTAAKVAPPTTHAHEAIRACHANGRPIVIVSNNAPQAVRAYLDQHELSHLIRGVVGRAHARPDLMKPHPDPVRRALAMLGARPDECVLVGDSDTDMQVARATGVHPVGFANRPGKRTQLERAGAEVVIDSMAAFAAAVSTSAGS